MTSTLPVAFAGDRMRVRFDRFAPDTYDLFLRCKALPESAIEFDPADESYTLTSHARFAGMLGVERPPVREDHPVWPALRNSQRHLVSLALDAKRFALWCACGFGKTLMGLEFARQVSLRTGGRVLVTTLNDVVREWQNEAGRWYGEALPLTRLESRKAMREWMNDGSGVAVTNYEKWNPESLADQVVPEAKLLAGAVLDENRLKTGGGKQKWAMGKSLKGVEYKLSLTATPAPNALMEFASQAMFLEKMRSQGEIIWSFFTRDPKTHRWTVKPHARAAFFEWMATWSVYVNDPTRYGWGDGDAPVPKPTYQTIEVPATEEQLAIAADLTADQETGQRFLWGAETNAIQRLKLSQVAKGFRYVKRDGKRTAAKVASKKPAVVCDIIKREATAGAQVLVWTVFDRESEILSERLRKAKVNHELLTGKTRPADRGAILDRVRSGETRVLVTRAAVLGWGMNLQMFAAMVFSGWTDSFEQFYQAVRRAYRRGQTASVRVYFPVVRELEGDSFDNIGRKEEEFERSIAEMEVNYLRAQARLTGKAA